MLDNLKVPCHTPLHALYSAITSKFPKKQIGKQASKRRGGLLSRRWLRTVVMHLSLAPSSREGYDEPFEEMVELESDVSNLYQCRGMFATVETRIDI